MADTAVDEKLTEEYWRKITGEKEPPPKATAPAPAGRTGTRLEMADETEPPSNQFGVGSKNPVASVARQTGIGLNQAAIGSLGIPAFAARNVWDATDLALDTADVSRHRLGPHPSWMEPQTYGPALTVPQLTPQNAGERIWAAGARAAGTAAPFAGPRGAMVAGIAGGMGQGLREAGYPQMGDVIDMIGGLRTRGAIGGPGTVPGTGIVGRTPRTPGASPDVEKSILRTIAVEPIAHALGPGLGTAFNVAAAYGSKAIGAVTGGGGPLRSWSDASKAAARIAGGYLIGHNMQEQAIPTTGTEVTLPGAAQSGLQWIGNQMGIGENISR